MTDPIIIVGTGLAGYQLAREFRKADKTTPLLIITANDGRFYPKPQLSNALTLKKNTDSLTTFTAQQMEKQLNAVIRTHTCITSIQPKFKTIHMGSEKLLYQKLVLASGAQVIKPTMKGESVEHILSINHIEDYAIFEKSLQDKTHITILGAGLIGCEFANDLSNAEFNVHLIDLAPYPLSLLVPREVGMLLEKALADNGVHFHLNCIADEMRSVGHDQYELLLSNGEKIKTDLVVSAIGLRPNLMLAQSAGIVCGRGIQVNAFLETSEKDIYALGDCAEVEGHVLPYITPILNAARALGKTLAGDRTSVEYPAMPITVKTPAHPIVVCPPPRSIKGEWRIEYIENSARALFYNEDNKLYGFVLTNEAVKEKNELANQLPKLI